MGRLAVRGSASVFVKMNFARNTAKESGAGTGPSARAPCNSVANAVCSIRIPFVSQLVWQSCDAEIGQEERPLHKVVEFEGKCMLPVANSNERAIERVRV